MEMPGHRWLKIDVEKSKVEAEERPVEVTVRDSSEPPAGHAGLEEPAAPEAASVAPPSAARNAEDGEPVYDLLELGAVEYTEDTRTQR
jgi:hypothetical protein